MGRNRGSRERDQTAEEGPGRRTVPEWITFAVSLGIVVIALGIVLAEFLGPENPVRLETRVELARAYRVGNSHYLPVTIVNRGGEAVENAMVRISLSTAQGVVEETELQFRFLGAGSQAEGVAIFRSDPSSHSIETRVIGYLVP